MSETWEPVTAERWDGSSWTPVVAERYDGPGWTPLAFERAAGPAPDPPSDYVAFDGAIVVPAGWGESWWDYTPFQSTLERKAMVVYGDSTTFGSGGPYSWLQRLRDRAVTDGYDDGGKGIWAGLEKEIVYDAPEINGVPGAVTWGNPGDGFDTLVGSWLREPGTVGSTFVGQFRESNLRLWYMRRFDAGEFTYSITVAGNVVASGTITDANTPSLHTPKFRWIPDLPAGTKTITLTNTGGGSVRAAIDGVNDTGLQVQKQAMSGMQFLGMWFGQLMPSPPYTSAHDGFRFQAPLGLTPNVSISGPTYAGMTVDTTYPAEARIKPCLAIDMLGFNDLTSLSAQSTPALWTEHVRRFAAACRAAGVDGLVLSGQLPYNSEWPTYGPDRYNARKDEALAQGLAFADMFYPIDGPSLEYVGGQDNPHLNRPQYETQADWLWDNLLGLDGIPT